MRSSSGEGLDHRAKAYSACQHLINSDLPFQLSVRPLSHLLYIIHLSLTTSGIPITAVTALLDLPPTLPPPSAPPHNSLCFSIPTITKVSQIKDSLPQWNEVLHKAHETTYTLEFNLSEDEKVRESFEELLGKDFELNSKDEQQKEGDAEVDTSKGAKFVIGESDLGSECYVKAFECMLDFFLADSPLFPSKMTSDPLR